MDRLPPRDAPALAPGADRQCCNYVWAGGELRAGAIITCLASAQLSIQSPRASQATADRCAHNNCRQKTDRGKPMIRELFGVVGVLSGCAETTSVHVHWSHSSDRLACFLIGCQVAWPTHIGPLRWSCSPGPLFDMESSPSGEAGRQDAAAHKSRTNLADFEPEQHTSIRSFFSRSCLLRMRSR